MATLYVENIPTDVYEALRQHAKRNRKSIASEVIALLKERIPTAEALAKRQELLDHVLNIKQMTGAGSPSSIEDMLRVDRER